MSFDTRHKIITPGQATTIVRELRDARSARLVFISDLEILRAEHVQKLEQLAAERPGKLFVVLTEPESALVPIESRAELTAALRVVDYVIPSPQGANRALEILDPSLIVDDREEDRGRTRQLVEHVRSRSPN